MYSVVLVTEQIANRTAVMGEVIFLQEMFELCHSNVKIKMLSWNLQRNEITFIPCLQITCNYYMQEWQS